MSKPIKTHGYGMSIIYEGYFDSAESSLRESLAKEGFGILTEIDVSKTLKNKLNLDYPRYLILGACNPGFAHKALQMENKIGTMLPCNVIVQQTPEGKTEVSAVDPAASMQAIDNTGLGDIAGSVREVLQEMIREL